VTLTIGEKVVYPCQGPCFLDQTIVKLIDGAPKSFYHLVMLSENGGELFVPIDKVQAIGIRPLLSRSEIPMVLERLGRPSHITQDWKRRAGTILSLFTTGSAFDMAEIIGTLTGLRQTKELSVRENWALNRAKALLVCEISEVMEETRTAAEERVDQALAPLITNSRYESSNRLDNLK
jgi:CarD family transcriptional regulator